MINRGFFVRAKYPSRYESKPRGVDISMRLLSMMSFHCVIACVRFVMALDSSAVVAEALIKRERLLMASRRV